MVERTPVLDHVCPECGVECRKVLFCGCPPSDPFEECTMSSCSESICADCSARSVHVCGGGDGYCGGAFGCADCGRFVGWCMGADDEYAALCDDCAALWKRGAAFPCELVEARLG